MESALTYTFLALAFPFLGGIGAYLAGNRRASAVGIFGVAAGFLFALLLLAEVPVHMRWEWLPGTELGWYIDPIAIALICLVYFISLLVHLFSVHYMKGDPGLRRYFFSLGFFTSSMLCLLAADHFILLFVFWELVGFSSFLLIGFWFKDVKKARLAREAFMINRVADAFLLVGVIVMVLVLDSGFISELSVGDESFMLHLAGFCLVVGALGKSAQFPFFGWLPKAMAGPTPVSALIHAATMVAAGVYLLVRIVPVMTVPVQNFTAFSGAFTALIAAYAALTQHDIKKVLAFSTISQLGYMVMGVGVGAHEAALFHLWTHAFFKAGLFLAAGSVIHYMHEVLDHKLDPQDMRNMGGLQKFLPVTGIVFIICGLALSGLPLFSGFLSKEGLLAGAWGWADQLASGGGVSGYLVPFMAFFVAILTPIYIGRQILLVFFGESRFPVPGPVSAEPLAFVKIPLLLLGIGSLWFFSALNPLNAHGWWLRSYLFSLDIVREEPGMEVIQLITLLISVTFSLAGLAVAYYLYRPGGRYQPGYARSGLPAKWYGRMSFRSLYIQEIYALCAGGYDEIVKFAERLDRKIIDRGVNALGVSTVVFSKFLAIIDREIVDGLVNFVAWISGRLGGLFSRIQAARVQTQIAWMVITILFIIFWFQLWGE